MIFGEVVVDAHQRRRVVVEALVGSEGRRKRKSEVLNEIQEARYGIRIGAKSLESERIGGKEREERIGAPREGERAEREQLVLDDRAARPEVDLILGVFLPERRVGIVHELEIGIPQRTAH